MLHGSGHVGRVLPGGVEQPGAEVGLHEAMREPDAVAAQLNEIELRGPGGSQPGVHVEDAGPGARLLVDGREPTLYFGGERRVLQVVELHLQSVKLEAGARQRGEVLDCGVPLRPVQRHLLAQVTADKRALPGLQQPEPQPGPVHAPGVDDAVLPGRGGLQQSLDLKLARDLQIQRRLDDLGGLDDPGQPPLVLTGAVTGDVSQRRLVAERLQGEHRGLGRAQRIMRPRRDDERQVLLMRLPDGGANDVVPFRVGDQRFFQAVGEHDDLAILDQSPPDGLAFGPGQQTGVDFAEESLAREDLEVKLGRGVPELDRHRDGALLRQQFGKPDQDGGLAGADAADQHMRPDPAVVQIRHHGLAQVIAADDLVDDGARGRNQLARFVPGPGPVPPLQPEQPPEQERRGQRYEHDGGEQVGEDAAGEAQRRAPAVRVEGQTGRAAPGEEQVAHPGQPQQEEDAGQHGQRGNDSHRPPGSPGCWLVDAAAVAAPPGGAREQARAVVAAAPAAPRAQTATAGTGHSYPPGAAALIAPFFHFCLICIERRICPGQRRTLDSAGPSRGPGRLNDADNSGTERHGTRWTASSSKSAAAKGGETSAWYPEIVVGRHCRGRGSSYRGRAARGGGTGQRRLGSDVASRHDIGAGGRPAPARGSPSRRPQRSWCDASREHSDHPGRGVLHVDAELLGGRFTGKHERHLGGEPDAALERQILA